MPTTTTTAATRHIHQRIADDLSVRIDQVNAAIKLLDEGATVPFIARYRKEATGGLDDTQLRHLDEKLLYLRELEERRQSILTEIRSQDKLTPALQASIETAQTKQRLEDLYLPYKVKRRTLAEIAIEAGLEPLADALLDNPKLDPAREAVRYLRPPFESPAGDNPGVADAKAALDGATAILTARFAQDAELLASLRDMMWQQGILVSQVMKDQEATGVKFRDYFSYNEAIAKVPPHRALALFRGRREKCLQLALKMPDELEQATWSPDYGLCERHIAHHFGIRDEQRAADGWLKNVVRLTWRGKLALSISLTLFTELRTTAEEEAIRVFARNLKDLLLAAPAGARVAMGLDPGIRTGVKVAVVDETGKLLDTATVYPFQPKNDITGSLATLTTLVRDHKIDLVAIGNGTGSRETEALVSELQKQLKQTKLEAVVVSEAGASVYSASEFAAYEFPNLDVSLRGAVSIARRLQDPLAELVKIDPKAIGVGQYQHDVSQTHLARSLNTVVEDCVNSVGVDLNMASSALLSRIAGLTKRLADNVVALRDKQGAFKRLNDLLKVPRLGPKAYEQAAGFLRITGGEEPLDASAVHPEAYGVVERMSKTVGAPVAQLVQRSELLKELDPRDYIDEQFGLPTVLDIISELEKPGRDPRPEFKTASFKAGINEIKHLEIDMLLEGVVTNVTNFGAFVDVGVHQDGLVHISALADTFVKDPHQVVKAGDLVKVKVVSVDIERKRIGLTMRLSAPTQQQAKQPHKDESNADKPDSDARKDQRARTSKSRATPPKPQGAMADAFARALKDK